MIKRLMILLAAMGLFTSLSGQEAPPSLFADLKARQVGDMVTVIIAESANASRQSQVAKDEDNRVVAQGSIEGNLLAFKPLFGLRSDLKTVTKAKEGSAQKDLITGRLAAVIIGITETGLFEIEGSKVININGERNLMTVTGAIRGRDIGADNTIKSYNVANAKIYYSKAGLGKVVKRGSFQRLANLLMGGAGLAIIGYVGGLSALAIIRSFSI